MVEQRRTTPGSGLHYMFVNVVRTRLTRRGNTNNVIVPRTDPELGRKGFSFRGSVFWNDLDTELKNMQNKNTLNRLF